jgi:hypothetical protein
MRVARVIEPGRFEEDSAFATLELKPDKRKDSLVNMKKASIF